MADTPDGRAETFPRPFGKYTLQREAGRGGKGVVYEAVDTVLQRRVALKVSLRGKAGPEEQKAEEERFLVEARIGAFLPKHAHIVGVYEAGEVEGQRYLSAEYVEGEAMTKWRKGPNVTMGQQVRLLRDVALAMEHAHGHGVVHRDLKPSNILVDRGGQPHVTDFGLAKMVGQKEDTAKSVTGKLWGTPAYMSPEHARGQEAGPRADVYSLGVMLYEILTGHTPFRGPTSTDVLGKVVRDTVVAPSKVVKAGTLTGRQLELEPVCMKALSKDPAQRQGSAKAFAEELTKWLEWGKTVRAEKKASKGLLIGGVAAAAFLGLVLVVVLATRKKGPSAEEAAARQAESERRLKEELEGEKKKATEEAAIGARLEAEERGKEERERLQKEMEAKRRADEEAALREQARLEAQRREAEERAKKAEDRLNQPPATNPAAETQPPAAEPKTANSPAAGTQPAGPNRPPGAGPAAARPVPATPPTGDPRTLESGVLHWEAEDFGGEDKPVAEQDYHDTTPGNVGKTYRPDGDVDISASPDGTIVFVYATAPGEWLRYRLKGGGRYEVEVKYLGRRPGTVHFEVDGVNVTGPVHLASAADRTAWTSTLAPTQNIPEGEHSLRLVFDTLGSALDYFRFRKIVVLPPPEAAQLREAEKVLREVFKAEYARRAPADQLLLARKLLQEALKTEGDPVARFVLFSEARDLGAQAGDPATILQAVDEMDKRFIIDAPAMKLAGLNAAARSVRTPESSKALADAFVRFAEAAAEQDDYDQAVALLSRAETAAKGAQNPALVLKIQARNKEMAALRDEFKPLKSSLKTLETKPDDAAANLAVGQYRCFVRDDWTRGLPMLARGSDAALAAIARKELEGADSPADEAALGDAWRELGEKKSGPLKTRCFGRALFWYEKASAEVTGLERLKVDSQIEALYKILGGDALKKGLVFWVEPGRDPGEGYRELVFMVKCNNNNASSVMDGAVKALSTVRGWIEYNTSDGVRTIEKQGSIFAWVKGERALDLESTCLVSRGDAGMELDDFSLGLYTGKPTARFNHGDAKTRSGALYAKGGLQPGKWALVGFTWEETSLAFYVDGKKDAEVALPAPLNPPRRYNKLFVGRNAVGGHSFTGLIGSVLIYNRELSPAEVTQLYVGSRAKFR